LSRECDLNWSWRHGYRLSIPATCSLLCQKLTLEKAKITPKVAGIGAIVDDPISVGSQQMRERLSYQQPEVNYFARFSLQLISLER